MSFLEASNCMLWNHPNTQETWHLVWKRHKGAALLCFGVFRSRALSSAAEERRPLAQRGVCAAHRVDA